MIKIFAEMTVKAECLATFKSLARELVEKSAAEEGNVSYSLNESLEDPCVLAFFEIWKDQAAIDSHNATEHFTTILPKLQELCAGGEPVKLFKEVQF